MNCEWMENIELNYQWRYLFDKWNRMNLVEVVLIVVLKQSCVVHLCWVIVYPTIMNVDH